MTEVMFKKHFIRIPIHVTRALSPCKAFGIHATTSLYMFSMFISLQMEAMVKWSKTFFKDHRTAIFKPFPVNNRFFGHHSVTRQQRNLLTYGWLCCLIPNRRVDIYWSILLSSSYIVFAGNDKQNCRIIIITGFNSLYT